ncbi:CapA family protein [Paenibacillus gansuensis]|uniref:CapA family protein n=1 Tax=Paenibacillus gansuensis TaxID=306542 RepID=A0ABW5PE73_9BACL
MRESRAETRRRQRRKKSGRLRRMIMINGILLLSAGVLGYTIWNFTGGTGNSSDKPVASATEQAADQAGSPGKEHSDPANSQGEAAGNEKPSGETGTDHAEQPDAVSGSEDTGSNGNSGSGGTAVEGNPPEPQSGDSTIHMNFVGDILLAASVGERMKKDGYDYPYRYVSTYFEQADLTVGNLETPVTEHEEPQSKSYVFKSAPETLPALKEAGFDVLNLANNHIMDHGTRGLLDTMKFADKAGFLRIGAGKNADEAYKPVIVTKNGIKVAFVGLSRVVPDGSWKAGPSSPGVAETYDVTRPAAEIQAAKKAADLVVVVVHWGKERQDRPVKEQTELARAYIDAGADLVVGGHPHVLQGVELYKGKWIAYSLGNFIFTTNSNPKTWDSAILEAECSAEGKCSLEMVPVLTKGGQPKPMAAAEGAALLRRISGLSIGASIGTDGKVHAE